MKKGLLFLAVIAATISMGQITVPTTTKSMYGTVEATWCGNCGQYGIPGNASVIGDTYPKAVYLVLHKSGTSALHSSTAEDIANEMGTAGQPIFTVNGNVIGPYSGGNIQACKDSINNFYSTTNADVNAGFNYAITADSILVETKTTFFNALSGDYYMGVYVYEDSIWEFQTNYAPGPDSNIWHNHVLRTSLNGSHGVMIASGSTSAGTDVDLNFSIELDPSWNPDQLHVFTMIWKDETGDFVFVNANEQGGALSTAAINEQTVISFDVFPNPSTGIINVSTESAGTISVYGVNGQLILQQTVQSGVNQIDLEEQNGMFILELQTPKGIVRKRIILS